MAIPKTLLRIIVYAILAYAVITVGVPAFKNRGGYNGFDLTKTDIPLAEILHGGPARDGIPAIDEPHFLTAQKVDFLSSEDRILGLEMGGEIKAYPIRILNWHEIVNDRVDGKSVLVSYCPLCGTGMAFTAARAGLNKGFGVSGLLYNSDMLLYDRETESLWSQILGRAVSGPRRGESLKQLPLEHTSWQDWLKRHPDTQVLSTRTGHFRDYTASPYAGYEQSEDLYFSVRNRDRRHHPKARVIGLVIEGKSRVWPYKELAKSELPINEVLAGKSIRVHFDKRFGRAWITDENGKDLPTTSGFWFAWMAFHPDSSVYSIETIPPK